MVPIPLPRLGQLGSHATVSLAALPARAGYRAPGAAAQVYARTLVELINKSRPADIEFHNKRETRDHTRYSRSQPYSAVFIVLAPLAFTRCSEDAAQCRTPALRLAYSQRRPADLLLALNLLDSSRATFHEVMRALDAIKVW